MSPLARHLRDPEWRYALAGALVSLPLLVLDNGLPSAGGTDLSLDAVTAAGLVAGYLAGSAAGDLRAGRAGLRAGLVGALPGLAWVGWWFRGAVPDLGWTLGPVPVAAVAVVFVLAVSAVALGIGALGGFVGGKVGGWAGRKVGRPSALAARG